MASTPTLGRPTYSIGSISPTRHLLSKNVWRGLYKRKMTNQPLLGRMCIQLLSLPSGDSGPK